MWPLLILPFVVLAGCSLGKDDKEKSSASATPPPKPPEREIPYEPRCLTDASCDWVERQAGIYDYVGAVYGEKGKVQFTEGDGKQRLLPLEKAYVEGRFGPLSESALKETRGTAPYFSKAHDLFFKELKYPQDPSCAQEPDSAPLRWIHPQFASADVFYGMHGCGKKYADQFLKSGVELSVAAEPEKWTFFLESHGLPIFDKVQLEEMALFTRIADTLKIPLKNPVSYRATSLEVRTEAAKKSKYTVEDFAVALVFQVAAHASRQNPFEDPQTIFRGVINGLAPELKMDSTDLFDRTRLYLRKYPKLKDQAEESDRRAKILAETANRMSRANLSMALQETKNDGHNLFVVGSNHVEMIRSVYSDQSPK